MGKFDQDMSYQCSLSCVWYWVYLLIQAWNKWLVIGSYGDFGWGWTYLEVYGINTNVLSNCKYFFNISGMTLMVSGGQLGVHV